MPADDWKVIALVVLVALSFLGSGLVFVGRSIEREAQAGPDNEISHAGKRSGGRFIVTGAFMTLSCALGAVVMAVFIAMRIQG